MLWSCFPTTVSIVSKPQKYCRSTQHLGCFKAGAAVLQETFLLKDTSGGEDILPPGRFGAVKKTNNTFFFPNTTAFSTSRTKKEWVYLLLNCYSFPQENLKNGDHSEQSQAGSWRRFSMTLITEGNVVKLLR